MEHPSHQRKSRGAGSSIPRRIGCVSFLNAKPLIDGFEGLADPRVHFEVPSRLLDLLEIGQADVALCPTIDYFRSARPLRLVPVGCIGCQGPTLTVRLFSQVPLEDLTCVHVDTDSHTSVALLQVVLHERYGVRPRLVDHHVDAQGLMGAGGKAPAALLLIGDKVVADAPPQNLYPYQADLGELWHELTFLPFVFAAWMTFADANLGDLPDLLDRQRLYNANRIDHIVARHAKVHGWPDDLARLYLGKLLRYQIGPEQIEAMELFAHKAHALGLIPPPRSIRLYG